MYDTDTEVVGNTNQLPYMGQALSAPTPPEPCTSSGSALITVLLPFRYKNVNASYQIWLEQQ